MILAHNIGDEVFLINDVCGKWVAEERPVQVVEIRVKENKSAWYLPRMLRSNARRDWVEEDNVHVSLESARTECHWRNKA